MRHPDIAKKVDFLSMGDNEFPSDIINQPWETSGTMNHSWGYHQLDYHLETTQSLLAKLLGNVSRNGNFQLNIGPMADGTFPKASVRRLREIGAWLYVNGEAVYGAGPSVVKGDKWGFVTRKVQETNKNRLFLNIVNWPENRELVVKGIDRLPEKVYLLETGQKLDFVPYTENGMTIRLPNNPIDSNVTVVMVE
jgi:alpha-L-fucosidase